MQGGGCRFASRRQGNADDESSERDSLADDLLMGCESDRPGHCRCRCEIEQSSARSHDEDGTSPRLVIQIVEQNRRHERAGEPDAGLRAPDEHGESAEEKSKRRAPGLRRRDATGGNRTFPAMLAVELHIRRIVQEHAAGVDQRTAGEQPGQRLPVPFPTGQQPPGEDVRPDRRQVGDAGEFEPGTQMLYSEERGSEELQRKALRDGIEVAVIVQQISVMLQSRGCI